MSAEEAKISANRKRTTWMYTSTKGMISIYQNIGGHILNSCKQFVKDYLTKSVRSLRLERNMTQEKMAEHLHVTSRAYGDLERGKFCFSATTLIYLLLMLSSEELIKFMAPLRKKLLGSDDTATSRHNG